MIIPARWYAGGRGLNDFRNKMLNNSHLRILVDYPKSRDCFEGVDIAGGVCYFLYDNQYSGHCIVTNCIGENKSTVKRSLSEFPIFIRYNKSVDIIRKVKIEKIFLSETGFTSNPFGFRSFVRGNKDKDNLHNIALITSDGINYISEAEIEKNKKEVAKYKVCFGKINPDRGGVNGNAINYNVINKPFIIKPNEIISETYLLIKTFDNINSANNCITYLKTRIARFLIFMSMSSMNITNNNLMFLPDQDFSKSWTDEELYAKYSLNEEEIAFIESMIKPME
jgi:site-specific DNA-methyltransferase (adenine-specific)